MADRTDTAIALALASTAGRELLAAIAESPRARRAAETFAAALLTATSAAELEQRVAALAEDGGCQSCANARQGDTFTKGRNQ